MTTMGILLFSEASLEDLITAAQADPSNDSGAMKELLARFEPLAHKIGRGTAFTRDTRDDAINAARWGLVLAVRAHKAGTAGFPAFAKLYMRGEATRRSRALVDPRCTPTADLAALDTARDISERGETLEFGATVSLLAPAQRELVVRRYVDDEPLLQIASDLGVTVSAVSQRLGTIHKKLQIIRPPVRGQVAA
jgi:RNA polymerase sigma factor (sigma-70 family)